MRIARDVSIGTGAFLPSSPLHPRAPRLSAQRALRLLRNELFEAIYSTEVTLDTSKGRGSKPSLERLPYAFLCQRLREAMVQERAKHETALETVEQDVSP